MGIEGSVANMGVWIFQKSVDMILGNFRKLGALLGLHKVCKRKDFFWTKLKDFRNKFVLLWKLKGGTFCEKMSTFLANVDILGK